MSHCTTNLWGDSQQAVFRISDTIELVPSVRILEFLISDQPKMDTGSKPRSDVMEGPCCGFVTPHRCVVRMGAEMEQISS